jgi:hypothetical protein
LLTEVALLGNVALESPGQTLQWNASQMNFGSNILANRFLHKDYRAGWKVTGLG